jgi:hypothetical protein
MSISGKNKNGADYSSVIFLIGTGCVAGSAGPYVAHRNGAVSARAFAVQKAAHSPQPLH